MNTGLRAVSLVAAAAMSAQSPAMAQAPKVGDPPEARNMVLVSHHDLQGRSAYQPTIHKRWDGRFILYVGHHGGSKANPKPVNALTGQPELNGVSILDVTNPKAPKLLAHIPGDEGSDEAGGSQFVRVCDGGKLAVKDPKKVYMLRAFGKKGHETWDVSDPAKPVLLWRNVGLKDTHKSEWECETGIAYLASWVPGWAVRGTEIFDMSRPESPQKIRDFGLVGQEPGAQGKPPMVIHGPLSRGPEENRVYFAYGTNRQGIVQIVDREKLLKGAKEPAPENLRYPQIGRLDMSPLVGAHTAYPLGLMKIPEFAKEPASERNMIMVVNEVSALECTRQARQMVWFVDATVEEKPMVVSHWTVREASGNFCQRGGRFGAHSSAESMAPVYYRKLAFISWFNAGTRVLDIRNPYEPREVAYFIPPITKKTEPRCLKLQDGTERCKVAIQTNNVETDERGVIYSVDRANTGLHILSLTGEARRIAGLK